MKKIHVPAALLLLLAACGGPEKSVEEKAPPLVIGGEDADATAARIYQMPTPNELFNLVKDLAGEGHKRLLNPTTNAEKYVSRKGRAINFGIYSTDLVYASQFNLNVEVARYYVTTKKLSESLGIATAFDDVDFARLEKNITRGDSLEVISNTVYLKAYEKLQDEQMGSTLALVLGGGWVESMHLMLSQVEAFGQSEAFTERIGEQKVTLEHLISIMDTQVEDADVQQFREQLVKIRDVYDRMEVKHLQQIPQQKNEKLVIGGDMQITITPEIYADLSAAVSTLREEITRPEDQTRS